jgi:fucokinase
MEIQRALLMDRGSVTFLQQAHRNNWERYLASLRAGDQGLQGAVRQGWDLCILTASDERQAAVYRQQLAWRRPAGLLPASTRFLVVPDPARRRLGSGGATLHVLAQLLTDGLAQEPCSDPAGQVQGTFSGRPELPAQPSRILLIHSGGDSKRLPHCSATGKLFARVPRLLPDGRASTVFDEFLIGLSGLASELPPGVLVASGDVLLIFDHLQLAFRRGGVIGVAAAALAETGLHHGVYISASGSHRVRAYLHKPAAAELAQWEGIDRDGTVQIDTGLVWWDQAAVQKLVALAHDPAVTNLIGPLAGGEDESAHAQSRPSSGLNLYGDLLLPLAQSTTLPAYLADTSDGPIVPGLTEARQAIWDILRGTPFSVERLQPAVFVHFGTSAEYWHMAAADVELARLCSWDQQAAAWIAPAGSATGLSNSPSGLVAANAALEGAVSLGGQPALVIDSQLAGPLSCEGAAVIAGVRADGPIRLADGTVLHQLPVRGAKTATSGGFVTQIFGMQDNPKRAWDDPAASFLNRPWHWWLTAAGIHPEIIWPDMQPADRTLWNAKLFPVAAEREESLHLALPLQAIVPAPDGWTAKWAAAKRLSLAESAALADGDRLNAELAAIEDHVVACRFLAAVQGEEPAALAGQWFKQPAGDLLRRSQEVAGRLAQGSPWLQVRGYRALAEALGDRRWEDRAFEVLAGSIKAALPASGHSHRGSLKQRDRQDGAVGGTVRVQASARVDFGGGWTDTPPYSIERGGTVLNAAVRLRGIYPVFCEAMWLDEPRLILESRDLDAVLEPACAGEILAYANPADPFALCKAALVLHGIVPAGSPPGLRIDELCRGLGGGLRLSTGTTIPRGSGLGTSSIMAGAVLACLNRLLQPERLTQREGPSGPDSTSGMEDYDGSLFAEVLVLEQMLTTGGGWQDQVGGLVGGVKLLTTAPGLPQQINIEHVRLPAHVEAELAARLLLVYTGQQRLAKNLLRAIMSHWMARERKMVWVLDDLARLAHGMHQALAAGDVTGFGALMGEHWVLNKRMDPGCTNPFIDQLFTLMEPYITGAKLAGAGGGGFAIVVARDAEAGHRLPVILEDHLPGTPVAVWPCAVPVTGMTIDETQ